MPHRSFGTLFATLTLGTALAITLPSGVSAQVATLVGPDEDAGPSPSAEETIAPTFENGEEALLAYAQCMRDNGIAMDDPQAGTTGGRGFFRVGSDTGLDIEGDEFQAAQMACAPILEAARPELDPAAQAERMDEMLLLAQCMRDHGIEDYPDPFVGPDGRLERTGGRAFAESGLDPGSEAFQLARETCAAELGVEVGPGRPGPGAAGSDPQVGG